MSFQVMALGSLDTWLLGSNFEVTWASMWQVSPIVVDRDDVSITYGSFDVHPPAHCNYYFRH